ncbi:MAG: NAD(P)/FAD-dependent oxidoreductase [Desulfobacterota bacterium]|nr:NAD(P)/FAD-dependent oxidoreductase [Thermodesulfobacteriota bacterium]
MSDLLTCDVLVVGAGPAGSLAARTAACRGVTVLLAERRQQVGVPVRCAEFVPLPVRKYIDLTDPALVAQGVKAMRTFIAGAPGRESLFPGAMIRRERFDQELARQAAAAGAKLRTGLQVYGRTPEGVRARAAGREVFIRCRVIVGADGPSSQVGRWMGQNPGPCLAAAQVSCELTAPLDHTRVYFQPDIFGGYGWVFPKGGRANVGVGLTAGRSRDVGKSLAGFWRQRLEEGLVQGPARPAGGGLVPVGGLRDLWQGDMILAGDAAGTCQPISGAGVGNALISGELAGAAAAAAVRQGSRAPLEGYREELRALLGPSLSRAAAKREGMLRDWNGGDFNRLIKRNWIAFKEYFR